MRRETCAEIIVKLQKQIPGHPILMRVKGKTTELLAMANEYKWDIYKYKSHGYIFTRIAKGLSNENLTKLKMKLKE